MFCWKSLRNSSSLICRSIRLQRLVTSSSESDSGGDSVFKSLISSGILIFGSSLGFVYCCSDLNSLVSFADSPPNEKIWDDHPFKHEKKPRFLVGDSYRRRVFFNYEKRIRMQSPPEKVFEYFASYQTSSGELMMTPADLMRALVLVFPPSESSRVREGFLRGERAPGELHCAPSKFFMLFDTNNDGLISFSEYIFFITLLSIPESSFSVAFKMFDLDNNGEIDMEEFRKVMTLMRDQYNNKDRRRGAMKTVECVENGGVIEYFFGKDGKSSLKHERFVSFLRELRNEILQLEFSHYDYKKRGTIPAKDFALSMVASADIGHISKLLDRVDEINKEPRLQDIHITFEEFKNFSELRTKLQSFSLAIFSYGKANGALTKQDFQRAASQVCDISMTDNVVDIIFHVFDANRDGSLSINEFVRVLHRQERDFKPSKETGFNGLLGCWWKCATKTSSSTKHFP